MVACCNWFNCEIMSRVRINRSCVDEGGNCFFSKAQCTLFPPSPPPQLVLLCFALHSTGSSMPSVQRRPSSIVIHS